MLDAKYHSYATTDEGVLSRPYSPRNFSPASFVRVNGKIRAREVRVIGVDGKQLGVITLNDAINLARQNGVDLVALAMKVFEISGKSGYMKYRTVPVFPQVGDKINKAIEVITTKQMSAEAAMKQAQAIADLKRAGVKIDS